MGVGGSKTNFATLISQLAESQTPTSLGEEFWDPFWSLSPMTPEEWNSLLTLDRIRELKKNKPQNLAVLLKKV